jgi:hypothetical protein
VLILDSGGLGRLAERSGRAAALISTLRDAGLWPPVVPTVVLAESMSRRPHTDASVRGLLMSCQVEPTLPSWVRSSLRWPSRMTVLTSDAGDVEALAAHAHEVAVEVV